MRPSDQSRLLGSAFDYPSLYVMEKDDLDGLPKCVPVSAQPGQSNQFQMASNDKQFFPAVLDDEPLQQDLFNDYLNTDRLGHLPYFLAD